MGNYYRFVNYSRREFVNLDEVRFGGTKNPRACGDALVFLMEPPGPGDRIRGSWSSAVIRNDDDQFNLDLTMRSCPRLAIVGCFDFEWSDIADYLDITPTLVEEMRSIAPPLLHGTQGAT